jgi:hypothetical protein
MSIRDILSSDVCRRAKHNPSARYISAQMLSVDTLIFLTEFFLSNIITSVHDICSNI